MEELLKEILESYKMWEKNPNYYYSRGKGTKKYTLDRISVLRSELLKIQNKMKDY